jgi:hypothetical protein
MITLDQVKLAREYLADPDMNFQTIAAKTGLSANAVYCLDVWLKKCDDETAVSRLERAENLPTGRAINTLARQEGWS